MANEWPVARVGDLAQSISETHRLSREKLVFLNTSDILLGKILNHSYSSIANWPGQAKKSIKKADILFSEIRPANGRYAYVDIEAEDYVVSTKLMVIRAKGDRILPRFLYHFLTHKNTTAWLQHLAESRSGTFPQITFDQIADLELPLPPLTKQATIAAFLDKIGDKIELNCCMNETLQAMARTIFRSWFVDFDPVHAKAAGHQPFGVNIATAALFPDSFEDSALGKIPRGWKSGSIAEAFNVTMGQSPPGWTYNESELGIPFFQGSTDFGFRYPERRVYCTAPTRLANPGDTLVSVRAPVGDINIASAPSAIGRGVAAIRHKTGSRSYTYYATHSLRNQFSCFEGDGTVFGAINKDSFLSLKCVLPTTAVVESFERLAFPLDQSIESNEKQSRTLSTVRDALLPKLMSGQIRVAGIERATP